MALRFRLFLLALLLLLPLLPQPGAAQAGLLLAPGQEHYFAGRQLAWIEDAAQQCDFSCARDRFARGQSVASDVDTPNFGLTGTYWFHLPLALGATERDWVAEARVPFLDRIDLYLVGPDRRVTHRHSGDHVPMSLRPLQGRNLAFRLALEPAARYDLYFRVHNEGPVSFPLTIESYDHFRAEAAMENLSFGVYFGVVLAILVYNLFIWLMIHDDSHLLYALFAAANMVTMGNIYGYSILFLWPENTWLGNRTVPMFVLLTAICGLLFTRSFLGVAWQDARGRVLLVLISLQAVALPAALLLPFSDAVRIIYPMSLLVAVSVLTLGFEQLLRGNRAARYFMAGWVMLLGGMLLLQLRNLGLLPSMFMTDNGILFGSAIECIMLSLALADRFALIHDQNIRLQTVAKAELQERVEERTRALDQALHSRSEFLATISHEIRTPMNGVIGITDLLLETDLTAQQREYAQTIQGAGRTLLTIINDVLDYSKIEAGKMTLEHVPFSVREVLNNAIRIFQAEAGRKKLRFITAIDDDVPPEIMGDPVRLQQVLNNLLSNAIKFTEHGEITLRVHREADRKLTFAVSDTGIGIDAAIQPKLFEAFNQGDQSMTRRYGGTGLGLAISRRLIELMGGSISLESDLGRGTTFYFTIPVKPVGSGAFAQLRAESRKGGGPLHLLVVDDNAINLQVAAGLLRKLGHTVDCLDSGRQAVEVLADPAAGYDAVFMDCEMPDMDGFAATREIRRREQAAGRPRRPVIALTAHAFAEKIAACHAAGMDDHLAKPLNLRLLEQTLARIGSPTDR